MGRGKLVAGLATSLALKEGANVSKSAFAYQTAKVQAQAQVAIAKATANASKFNTSVTEADEILSICDRPFVRFSGELSPGLQVEANLSIMSIMGLMACFDLGEQYTMLSEMRRQHGIVKDARDNTQLFQGLLGQVPLDASSLALLSGAIPTPSNNRGNPVKDALDALTNALDKIPGVPKVF